MSRVLKLLDFLPKNIFMSMEQNAPVYIYS